MTEKKGTGQTGMPDKMTLVRKFHLHRIKQLYRQNPILILGFHFTGTTRVSRGHW